MRDNWGMDPYDLSASESMDFKMARMIAPTDIRSTFGGSKIRPIDFLSYLIANTG
jgi:hypothetical protein